MPGDAPPITESPIVQWNHQLSIDAAEKLKRPGIVESNPNCLVANADVADKFGPVGGHARTSNLHCGPIDDRASRMTIEPNRECSIGHPLTKEFGLGGDPHRDTHLATTNEFVRVHRQVVSSIDTFLSKFPIYS